MSTAPSRLSGRSPNGSAAPLPPYLPSSEDDPSATIEAVREGLPAEAFDWLKRELGLTAATLADALHVSRRTVNHRKKEGRFKTGESERVLRLARLYRRAAEVLSGPGSRTDRKGPSAQR